MKRKILLENTTETVMTIYQLILMIIETGEYNVNNIINKLKKLFHEQKEVTDDEFNHLLELLKN